MKPDTPGQNAGQKTGKTAGGRSTGLERRDLLKSLGLGAAGAAAATVLPSTGAPAAESPADQIKARYRETEHVKRFYALNRL